MKYNLKANMNNIDDHIERTNQQVWKKNGITYVPHYRKPDVFIGPGWAAKVITEKGKTIYHPMEYTLQQLISAGAVASEMFLWPREV